jgi:NAD(P)-dependent dehydrogenase (short-subunit alcohol dehydrogenase family)
MQTQFNFSGKVVVVTGASGAIGMAVARRFHLAGAHVIAAGRREDALQTLASQLGERCETVAGDLADASHRHDLMGCAKRLGGVDILINNAGLTQTKVPSLETDLGDFDRIFDVNLRATWALSLDAIREWVAHERKGVIVNVSSPGAQRAHRNNAIYDMTKGGMDALTRCLAADFGRYGIRVNAIAPAQIPHSHVHEVDPAAARGLPLPRHGDPDEAAGPVLFLASDAASFVTGHVLPVDGGLLAQLRTAA